MDVIYRRIDDEFLDPEVFNPDSLIGVPGLMRAWRAGNVALANAPGAGVADDKLVYSYVPDLIRYYLGEDPMLPNVPTFRLFNEGERRHVLADLRRFVVKPANESGGYGVVVGSKASEAELAAVPRIDREGSAQLHRAADHPAIDGADAVRRRHRAAAPGPAALHPQRRRLVRHARRPDPRGAAQGISGGQLFSRWRQQGHLHRR